jgi:hypothetical protein
MMNDECGMMNKTRVQEKEGALVIAAALSPALPRFQIFPSSPSFLIPHSSFLIFFPPQD